MAESTTVRVRRETQRRLAEMAERSGTSIPEVIHGLVERAHADEVLAAHNRAVAGEEYTAETESLAGTLGDGLGDPWPVDEKGRPER